MFPQGKGPPVPGSPQMLLTDADPSLSHLLTLDKLPNFSEPFHSCEVGLMRAPASQQCLEVLPYDFWHNGGYYHLLTLS